MDVGRAVARVHGRQDAGLPAFGKQSGAVRVRLGVPSGARLFTKSRILRMRSGLVISAIMRICPPQWRQRVMSIPMTPSIAAPSSSARRADQLSRREDLRAAGVGSPGQWLSLVLGRGSSASLWPALAIPAHVSHCSGCGGTAPAVSAPNAPAAIIDAGTAVLRFIILLIISSLVWSLSKPTRMLVGDKAKQPRI